MPQNSLANLICLLSINFSVNLIQYKRAIMMMNLSLLQFSMLPLSRSFLVLAFLVATLTVHGEDHPTSTVSQEDQSSATKESTNSLWDSVKDKAGSTLTESNALWNNLKNKTESSFTEAKDWSVGKLNESLEDMTKAVPIIQEAGFDTSRIAMTMSLVPTLTLEFKQVKVITPEEQEKLLKSHEDQKILSYILQSLFKTYSLQFGKYKIASTEIALTVPPTTTVRLSPEEVPK